MTDKTRNKANLWGKILIYIIFVFIITGARLQAFTLSGIVSDINNSSPVQAVAVQMYFMGNPIGNAFDTTDISGFYSIDSIPGATYDIQFTPNPSSNLQPRLIANFILQSDSTLDVTLFPLDHYYIEGIVTDTLGNGLPEIDLNIYEMPADTQITTTGDDTDSTGYYDVLIPSGTYRIVYRPIAGQLFVPSQLLNVEVNADTILNDIALLGGHHVQGTITGPNGPVFNADMDADDSFTGERIITLNDNTNGLGQYQIIVPTGTFDINVTPQFGDSLVAEIVYGVAVNNTTTLDFTLESGNVFSGTVLSPTGTGTPDVDLDVLNYNTGLKFFTPHDNTNQSGYFQMILPAGLYNIEIEPPQTTRYSAILLDSLVFNGDTVITALLDTGMYVSGTVIDSFGTGIPDVSALSFESSTGDFVFAPGNKTDSIGFYDIFIPPNTYNLVFKPDSLSGIPDTVVYSNVIISSDTIINVVFAGGSPDTEPPIVAVTAPNGGENWLANSTKIIMWNASDNIGVTSIDIYYSISGSGGPYNPVSIGQVNDGLYSWFVPTDTTNNAYIKIVARDAASNTTEDISNGSFTIFTEPDTIPPSIVVVTPNGGESWAASSTQTIFWNADDNIGVSSIDISYSITGPSGTYITIANGETNGGFYIWTVPSDTTANAYVKVVAYDGSSNSAEDISNAPFTIFASPTSCDYAVGDANNSGSANGLDVIFMVSYFKGGDPPPYICQCTEGSSWYVAGDVNASCSINGLDVTYLVGFFKGGPSLVPCPDCEPVP